jgi:hypothetical protein
LFPEVGDFSPTHMMMNPFSFLKKRLLMNLEVEGQSTNDSADETVQREVL